MSNHQSCKKSGTGMIRIFHQSIKELGFLTKTSFNSLQEKKSNANDSVSEPEQVANDGILESTDSRKAHLSDKRKNQNERNKVDTLEKELDRNNNLKVKEGKKRKSHKVKKQKISKHLNKENTSVRSKYKEQEQIVQADQVSLKRSQNNSDDTDHKMDNFSKRSSRGRGCRTKYSKNSKQEERKLASESFEKKKIKSVNPSTKESSPISPISLYGKEDWTCDLVVDIAPKGNRIEELESPENNVSQVKSSSTTLSSLNAELHKPNLTAKGKEKWVSGRVVTDLNESPIKAINNRNANEKETFPVKFGDSWQSTPKKKDLSKPASTFLQSEKCLENFETDVISCKSFQLKEHVIETDSECTLNSGIKMAKSTSIQISSCDTDQNVQCPKYDGFERLDSCSSVLKNINKPLFSKVEVSDETPDAFIKDIDRKSEHKGADTEKHHFQQHLSNIKITQVTSSKDNESSHNSGFFRPTRGNHHMSPEVPPRFQKAILREETSAHMSPSKEIYYRDKGRSPYKERPTDRQKHQFINQEKSEDWHCENTLEFRRTPQKHSSETLYPRSGFNERLIPSNGKRFYEEKSAPACCRKRASPFMDVPVDTAEKNKYAPYPRVSTQTKTESNRHVDKNDNLSHYFTSTEDWEMEMMDKEFNSICDTQKELRKHARPLADTTENEKKSQTIPYLPPPPPSEEVGKLSVQSSDEIGQNAETCSLTASNEIKLQHPMSLDRQQDCPIKSNEFKQYQKMSNSLDGTACKLAGNMDTIKMSDHVDMNELVVTDFTMKQIPYLPPPPDEPSFELAEGIDGDVQKSLNEHKEAINSNRPTYATTSGPVSKFLRNKEILAVIDEGKSNASDITSIGEYDNVKSKSAVSKGLTTEGSDQDDLALFECQTYEDIGSGTSQADFSDLPIDGSVVVDVEASETSTDYCYIPPVKVKNLNTRHETGQQNTKQYQGETYPSSQHLYPQQQASSQAKQTPNMSQNQYQHYGSGESWHYPNWTEEQLGQYWHMYNIQYEQWLMSCQEGSKQSAKSNLRGKPVEYQQPTAGHKQPHDLRYVGSIQDSRLSDYWTENMPYWVINQSPEFEKDSVTESPVTAYGHSVADCLNINETNLKLSKQNTDVKLKHKAPLGTKSDKTAKAKKDMNNDHHEMKKDSGRTDVNVEASEQTGGLNCACKPEDVHYFVWKMCKCPSGDPPRLHKIITGNQYDKSLDMGYQSYDSIEQNESLVTGRFSRLNLADTSCESFQSVSSKGLKQKVSSEALQRHFGRPPGFQLGPILQQQSSGPNRNYSTIKMSTLKSGGEDVGDSTNIRQHKAPTLADFVNNNNNNVKSAKESFDVDNTNTKNLDNYGSTSRVIVDRQVSNEHKHPTSNNTENRQEDRNNNRQKSETMKYDNRTTITAGDDYDVASVSSEPVNYSKLPVCLSRSASHLAAATTVLDNAEMTQDTLTATLNAISRRMVNIESKLQVNQDLIVVGKSEGINKTDKVIESHQTTREVSKNHDKTPTVYYKDSMDRKAETTAGNAPNRYNGRNTYVDICKTKTQVDCTDKSKSKTSLNETCTSSGYDVETSGDEIVKICGNSQSPDASLHSDPEEGELEVEEGEILYNEYLDVDVANIPLPVEYGQPKCSNRAIHGPLPNRDPRSGDLFRPRYSPPHLPLAHAGRYRYSPPTSALHRAVMETQAYQSPPYVPPNPYRYGMGFPMYPPPPWWAPPHMFQHTDNPDTVKGANQLDTPEQYYNKHWTHPPYVHGPVEKVIREQAETELLKKQKNMIKLVEYGTSDDSDSNDVQEFNVDCLDKRTQERHTGNIQENSAKSNFPNHTPKKFKADLNNLDTKEEIQIRKQNSETTENGSVYINKRMRRLPQKCLKTFIAPDTPTRTPPTAKPHTLSSARKKSLSEIIAATMSDGKSSAKDTDDDADTESSYPETKPLSQDFPPLNHMVGQNLPPLPPYPNSPFWGMFLTDSNSALKGNEPSEKFYSPSTIASPGEQYRGSATRTSFGKSYTSQRYQTGFSPSESDSESLSMRNDWKTNFKSFHSFGVKYIDTHCHLDFLFSRAKFSGNLQSYMEEYPEMFPDMFEGCVAVFCNPTTFNPYGGLWKIVAEEDNVWIAMGCHPKMVLDFTASAEDGLRKCLQHPKCIALGEIGLDYSGTFRQHEVIQKQAFRRQLEMAVQLDKPLVIHCREAEDDCLDILKELVPRDYKIHCHCFTGYFANAKLWMSAFPNLFIGVTPLVTYRSASPSHDLARHLPIDKLLLETDAPYFVPRCLPRDDVPLSNPGLAVTVAKEIAKYQDLPVAAVLRQARLNTKMMYGI